VARTLRHQRPDAEIHWLGGQRGIERELVAAEGYPLTLLAAPSLRVGDGGVLASLRDALALLVSIPHAVWYLLRLRPDVLFSTGGYVAIPAMIAAALTRTPSLIWEGNVQAGRSNRLIAPLARARAVAWPDTARRAPWNGPATIVTGTPVRSFDGRDRAAARARFGVHDERPILLVFGGSQRVVRFERALSGILVELLETWQIVHVVADGRAEAESVKRQLPMEAQAHYLPFDFLHGGGMEDALVAADVILGRAGASTLAEIAALGRASITVPYPFAGGHQRANAEALAAAGGTVLIDDAELTPERLRLELASFAEPAARRRVGAAAAALARPNAARDIAEALQRLVRR
jgi:UDP-N-acetylglucosamine--N-acetylmuramyl-(pentapeptide) pyrophosphoryl-undecaprenol N-acetylglucosamine transferase